MSRVDTYRLRADLGALDAARPVVVVALAGWFDVGGSATGAVAHLLARAESSNQPAELLVEFDVDTLFDLRAKRPRAILAAGVLVDLRMPAVHAHLLRTGGRHDLVLVHGTEPTFRWRTFADGVLDLAAAVGAEMVVTLGATPEMVPHNRALPIVTSASSSALARHLGLSLPRYQGPTGVAGVLQERLGARNVPGLSIRVSVPGYVAADGNPMGVQSLLMRLGDLFDIPTDARSLDDDVALWRRNVDDAVAAQREAAAMIAMLERQHDEAAANVDAAELVRELERYLEDGAGS
jgi:proteasome assembly chaperone (PAC2) family protein